MKYKRMNFIISFECLNMLQELKKQKGLSLSDLVRRSIEEFYDKNKKSN